MYTLSRSIVQVCYFFTDSQIRVQKSELEHAHWILHPFNSRLFLIIKKKIIEEEPHWEIRGTFVNSWS